MRQNKPLCSIKSSSFWLVIIVMSKQTSTVLLSRFSAQGRGTDSGHLHSRVYSCVACCMLGCYLLWFKWNVPHLLSWAFGLQLAVLCFAHVFLSTGRLKLLNVPRGQALFWEKMHGKREGGWKACWGVHLKTALSTSHCSGLPFNQSVSPSPDILCERTFSPPCWKYF